MLRSPLFRFHPRSSILKFTTTAKPKTAKSAFTAPKATEPSSGVSWFTIAAITALAGAGYYVYETQKAPNYQAIYNDIANLLEDVDYDDGSYGPVLVRLAWHASGTYDKETKTGGSNGATMRFKPESSHEANAGLSIAREILEPIKAKHPKISYSDLWTLAGVAAIQEMGGPIIKWRPGRKDAETEVSCTPDGRLPDGAKTQDHLREIFYRMGFNDQEIVALSGAHVLGRCHTDRSGFDGPWSFSPTMFTNDYFKLLLSESWYQRKWNGPKQFQDYKTKTLMMLPSDMSLINDKKFKPWVEAYAKDQELFFKDFSAAFQKLEELGVPFDSEAPALAF